jgi:hypothetical protein
MASGIAAQSGDGVAPDVAARVVEATARQITDRYVLVDQAPVIAGRLRDRVKDGASVATVSAASFAELLAKDLREISGDLHFAVEFDPARAEQLTAAGVGTGRKLPEITPSQDELDRMRRGNYGFRRVAVLDGNVGLIELTAFNDLSWSRETATAAMAFVAGSDAILFDLRRNPGGSGNLVNFLVSYLVPERSALMATFDRETGKTKRGHARRVPGRRLEHTPVYVVIGPGTGSAAEAFAFTLKQLGRARIVGEKSQGAAHGGGWVPVGDGFIVFIPTFRPFDPRTNESWEGVGVQPDIAAPADHALSAAQLRAVMDLQAMTPRPDLAWLVPLLGLEADGPSTPGTSELTTLTGKYQGIEISTADGDLRFLGASGIPRTLVPLSDGTFLIKDATVPPPAQARLRFVRDESGSVTGLELLTDSGRVILRRRL